MVSGTQTSFRSVLSGVMCFFLPFRMSIAKSSLVAMLFADEWSCTVPALEGIIW